MYINCTCLATHIFYETTLFILESMNLKHSKISIYTKSTKRYAHKHIYTKRFVLVVKKSFNNVSFSLSRLFKGVLQKEKHRTNF